MSRLYQKVPVVHRCQWDSLGAVLEQEGYVIAYFSKTLRIAKRNYSTMEQECLAIVESIKRFRYYLIGRKIEIFTNHKSLEWLHTQKAVGRLWRWAADSGV